MTREYIRNPRTGNLVLAHTTLGRRIARDLRRNHRPVVFETKEATNQRRANSNVQDDPSEDDRSDDDEVRPPDEAYTDRLLPPISDDRSQRDDDFQKALEQSRESYRLSVQKALDESAELARIQAEEKESEAAEMLCMQEEEILSSARESAERKEYLDKNIRELRLLKLRKKIIPKATLEEKPNETVKPLDEDRQQRANATIRRLHRGY